MMVGDDDTADRELIRRAKRGSKSAFGWLVRRYQERVYMLCWRLGGSHDIADDLTQEAFIKAYQAIDRFDERYPFWSWIAKIASNNAINYLQRRRFEVAGEEGEMVIDQQVATAADSNPHESLLQKQIDKRFDEALCRLPVDFRAVFVLRMHEDLSYDEIAKMLGITIGTVMSRLHRARKKLAEELKDLLEP
ncbi:MAG: sigma-70 family RNA polymerase sigma factor [candidate division Zixibacteria bacterium]|nr:sigma-70 family RNA polymerase sigma factor [candidate division Zixibacteria bacterium]